MKLDPNTDEYKRVANKFHMVDRTQQQGAVAAAGALPIVPVFGAVLGVGGAQAAATGYQYPGPGISIKSIHRVQNPKLWKIYSLYVHLSSF